MRLLVVNLLVPTSLGSMCLWSTSTPSSTWVGAGGVLVLTEQFKDVCQIVYISLEEELVPVLLLTYCFLTAFPLFLRSLTSLINNCLSLLFGIQGRPRRPKPFSTKKKWTRRGFFYPGGPHRVLLGFNPPFL